MTTQNNTNPLTTPQEIWEWLIAGNKIKNTINNCIYTLIDGFITTEGRRVILHFACPNEFIRVNWEDDIPKQGRLCWVSDDVKEPSRNTTDELKVIVSKINSLYRTTSGIGWNYATPLTNEEIREFLIEEED